jgi:succinoglycan biosynthesis transport protein ExoP
VTSTYASEIAPAAPRESLVARVWRNRKLAAAVFVATFALAVIALIVIPVRYFTSGSIIVAEQEPNIANQSAAWAQKIGDPADVESQLLVVRSPRILRLAVQQPGALAAVMRECRYRAENETLGRLAGVSACTKLESDSDALVEYVQGRYVVGSVGRSRVINIGYKSPLPDVARTMANALITAFLEDHRASITTGREVAATWLRRELEQLNDDLRDEDAKIQAFRRAKGLMRGSTAPIASERLTSISQQLAAAEVARSEAAARLEEIRQDQARGSANSPAVLASRIVGDLKQQIAVASGQLGNSAATLGPKHPTRVAQQQELDALNQRLRNEVASIASSAQQSLIAAEALVASLKRQMDEVKAEVATATSDEASIETMVRGAEIKRAQYAELSKRANELETEQRLLLGSTRLVTLAEMPLQPFFPKTLPFLAGGFTLAFLFGIGAALMRDRVDMSFLAIRPAALPAPALPLLAELPRLQLHAANATHPRFAGAPELPSLRLALRIGQLNPALQSALGQLTTNLALMDGDRQLRTILVASPGPGEGKSFTALALAQYIASTGSRVLVIDCDLRQPTFEGALGLRAPFGLTDALRGTVTPREAAVTTELATLDQLSAGRPVADATELLARPQLPELLAWAQKYDLVLLDGPSTPADALILARHVDGILCCARWGVSSAADAATAMANMCAAGGNVLGMVVTMAKPQDQMRLDTTRMPAGGYRKAS